MAVGLYGNLEMLGTGLTRAEQIGVQLLGIVVCAIWTFGVAYVLLRMLNAVAPLRVPAEHEDVGLNLSEHGEVEDYEIPDHVFARIRDDAVREAHPEDNGRDHAGRISGLEA
jgi:ammonia channel protein AmtB